MLETADFLSFKKKMEKQISLWKMKMGYVVGVWWEGGEGGRDRETNPQIYLKISGWALLKREMTFHRFLQELPK